MPLRRAFCEVKQKAFATGEGKDFFLPLWAKPKSWKQQKNKQKKKGVVAFLFVSSQQVKANVFCFFILVKTKKEQTLAGREVVAFFFLFPAKGQLKRQTFFVFVSSFSFVAMFLCLFFLLLSLFRFLAKVEGHI